MDLDRVLIVSGNEKGAALISELLNSSAPATILTAQNGGEARRMLAQQDFDLVTVNTPLPDEFGADFALFVTESTTAGVLLLVQAELADDVGAKVEDYGVFVVPKPISRAFFYQAYKLIFASRRRLQGLKKENIQLQNKIEEIRLVDRAKCSLIQYLGLSEAQAHRYIEKQAMDCRITRREVAENILKTYES